MRASLASCAALLALAAGGASAPASPTDWKQVNPREIAAWCSSNSAPQGVVADKSARTVRVLAEATGLTPIDAMEFLAIGPLSDRAYESAFVTVASPEAIAAAVEHVGVPRGEPPDAAQGAPWPVGEKVAFRMRPVSGGEVLTLDGLLEDRAEGENLPATPFAYTGGLRDASGAPVASTNIPCAVFALYSHAPSLFLFPVHLDQSSSYGRFHMRRTLVRGGLYELEFSWDGRRDVQRKDVEFAAASAVQTLEDLRRGSAGRDLYVRTAFAPRTTVAEAAALAKAIEFLDGKGVKFNGSPRGRFLHRSFLPDPKWRERAGRMFQPFEVRVAPDGTREFTFVEEDWSGTGLDPVLKPHVTPFRDWKELGKLIAGTGAAGEKIDVLFVFAPGTCPVSDLEPVLEAVGDRIRVFYVFGDGTEGGRKDGQR